MYTEVIKGEEMMKIDILGKEETGEEYEIALYNFIERLSVQKTLQQIYDIIVKNNCFSTYFKPQFCTAKYFATYETFKDKFGTLYE